MSKTLTSKIESMINNQAIKMIFILKINDIDYSSYLKNWGIQQSKDFGSVSATFTLTNDGDMFSSGGSDEVSLGDIVEFTEKYEGDTTEFNRFYGKINQRSFVENAQANDITLVCLDWISSLQYLDIDLSVEGTKVEVTSEILTPNYLTSPNDSLSQVFDFANNALADNPTPLIMIRNKGTAEEDPQFDGFEIDYENGQLKLGYPLNAKDNYDLICTSYYYYTHGVYAEDILEDILCQPDGYGKYIFNETSAQAVIDNHLTDTFNNVEAKAYDTLIPNLSATTIIIETTLTVAYDPDASGDNTSLTVLSTTGFPSAGQGEINGDIFTWTSKDATHLYGIPLTGSYALKAHAIGDYVEFSASYSAGTVWYLTYSNIQTDLVSSDFTIPTGTFKYFDKRYGRIILEAPIATTQVVTCENNYTFKTLQASAIELNKISFRSREVENRFEAIKKLAKYLAPNWNIRTLGDTKIWASYIYQKVNEDYTLKLTTSLNFTEDNDVYTRVLFYGKNKNPNNVMFNSGVTFATTGESYKGIASNSELTKIGEDGNYYIYGMSLSGIGEITANLIKPIVYINSVPIDNTAHLIAGQQVVVETTTTTETTTGK